MRTLATIAALAAAMHAGSAAARDGAELYDTCFARAYDAAHLKAHPDQRVTAMQAFFQEFEDNLWAGVYYTLRDGKKYAFTGDCYDPVDGGYLCHVCANDSCDQTGETFKVLWSDARTVDLVNDTTGVVGQDLNGKPDRLKPGGEHGAFRLQRTPDATACDWQTQ